MGPDRARTAEYSPGWYRLELTRLAADAGIFLGSKEPRLISWLRKTGALDLGPVRPIKRAAKALLWKITDQRPGLVLSRVNGHPMWIYRSYTSYYVTDGYEPGTSAIFEKAIRRGDVILDIGANVGFYTLAAARAAGQGGRVYAFEPSPENLEILKRNTALNRHTNVSCLGDALGDETGERQLIIADSPDCNSFKVNAYHSAKGTVRVNCTTVDSFLAGGRADVVKVDVEGAEVSVLRGMQRTLERNRCIRLFVELNPASLEAAGVSGTELFEILKEAGFLVWLIDERDGRSARD